MNGRFSRLAAAVAVAVAFPAAAAERYRLDLSHDVYFGGLRAGHIDTAINVEGSRYAIEASGGTAGLAGRMFPWRMEAYSRGRLERRRIVPAASGQRSTWRGRERFVDLAFAGSLPTVVRAAPASRIRNRILPDLRRGAVDPFAALMTVIVGLEAGRGCGTVFPVYDGRRLYDVLVRPERAEVLPPSRYASFEGPTVKCRVGFAKKAGFKRGRTPAFVETSAEVWMGRVFDDAPRVPVRVRFDVRMGSVVAHVVRARHRSPEGERVLR